MTNFDMFVDVVALHLSLPFYDVKSLLIISQRNALYCVVPAMYVVK